MDDVMPGDLFSTRTVPTLPQTYPQFGNRSNYEAIILQDYPMTGPIQTEALVKKARPSFISAHLRMLVTLGFLVMLGVSLLGTSGAAGGTLQHLFQGISIFTHSQPVSNPTISPAAHLAFPANAARQLVRISQLDPNQYGSNAEFSTWAYSACSTASMTEVFDAYGYHYRITDVLNIESQIGAITPDQGLVDPSGIASTAAKFGFKTQWGNDGTIDQIIATANAGKPVIVGFPPDRYEGGHLLVVIGGDSNNVFLADTSLWNRRVLSRDQFLQWWGGFYAVVTPKGV